MTVCFQNLIPTRTKSVDGLATTNTSARHARMTWPDLHDSLRKQSTFPIAQITPLAVTGWRASSTACLYPSWTYFPRCGVAILRTSWLHKASHSFGGVDGSLLRMSQLDGMQMRLHTSQLVRLPHLHKRHMRISYAQRLSSSVHNMTLSQACSLSVNGRRCVLIF